MKIRTLIFTLLTVIFLSSCEENDAANVSTEIQIIDDCEYIVSKNGYGDVATHKGNCNNPIHYEVIHDTIYVIETNKK